MKSLIIVSILLSIIFILILEANANSVRGTTKKSAINLRKRPPPISRTKNRPFNTRRRIRPATNSKSYADDSWCDGEPDGPINFHEDCGKYYECYEGFVYESECPPETPIFDVTYFDCMSLDEGAACYWYSEYCPEDSFSPVLVPGSECSSYYICSNYNAYLTYCAEGLHFNIETSSCDTPANANCDPDAEMIPPTLPDCNSGKDENVAHPFNCDMFIYCMRNGGRIVQQCPHLNLFDSIQGKCVIDINLKCQLSSSSSFRRT